MLLNVAAFEAIFVSFEMDFTKNSPPAQIAKIIWFSSQISDFRSQTWEIPANHSPTLPQRREGGPQLLNEQVGLFKGSKVTTPIKLIPVDQV